MKIFRYICGLPALVLSAAGFISCNKTDIITISNPGFEVVEYLPAPGQFINDGFSCNTMDEAIQWAQERLDKGWHISLGTFGGYITVKSEKEIKNKDGYDFCIKGNPMTTSSEPGIVWVSPDGNAWYQLKGKDTERLNYSVTYFQTGNSRPGDISWEDSDGNTGKVTHQPSFHPNTYYPLWVKENEYTLSGTRLECRLHLDETSGNWSTGTYKAGYADNYASDMTEMKANSANRFDISDAVDQSGKATNLDYIRYIKVQSAVIAPESSPLTGEVSTEVTAFGTL